MYLVLVLMRHNIITISQYSPILCIVLCEFYSLNSALCTHVKHTCTCSFRGFATVHVVSTGFAAVMFKYVTTSTTEYHGELRGCQLLFF